MSPETARARIKEMVTDNKVAVSPQRRRRR
jgi:hypothetical protein